MNCVKCFSQDYDDDQILGNSDWRGSLSKLWCFEGSSCPSLEDLDQLQALDVPFIAVPGGRPCPLHLV